jgi:transcriptional regulator with XRE-family HTH domain
MDNEAIARAVDDIEALWSATRRAAVMQQIRRVMRVKGIKSVDLAERLRMHPQSVSRLLRGNQNVQINTLYRFADALEVPLTITFD